MEREDAITATRHGAYAAAFSASMALILFLLAVTSDIFDEFIPAEIQDTAVLFDVVLGFVLAWLVYKKSRAAAIFLLLFFILSKLLEFSESGQITGIISLIIFGFFYTRATWGAFVFHKIEKRDNPDYKPVRKLIWIPAIITGVIFVLLVIMGLAMESGTVPSAEVQSRSELHPDIISVLIENNIITSRNDVEYFYTPDVFSVKGQGVLLTPTSLKHYARDDEDNVVIDEIPYTDIESIEQLVEGDYITNAEYQVFGRGDDQYIYFVLSVEGDKHLNFLNMLRSRSVNEIALEPVDQ